MATAKKVKKVVKVATKASAKAAKPAAKADKKAAKGDKTEKKATKSAKDMTPLEKARAARAAGGGAAKKKSKKKGLPIFKAPEDFKPFFMKTTVQVDKDGIISDMKVTRIKGSPTNENAKTVDMGLHDPDTLRRMFGRFAAVAFVRNEGKRLPAKSMAQLLMRVSANRETGALKVGVKSIMFKEADAKKGKALDKKDPKYRMLRKPVRLMPAAFTKVMPFPSAAEMKALLKGKEE